MRIARARLLGLSTVMSALALAGTAFPAHAATPTLTLTAPAAIGVDPAPSGTGLPGATLTLDFGLAGGGSQSGNGEVTIDTSPLKGIATVTAFGCTTASTTLTCPFAISTHEPNRLQLQLFAVKGGTPGSTATLHTTAQLTGSFGSVISTASSDTAVTFGGTKVTASRPPVNKGLKPGDTWAPQIDITNNGDLPATQLGFAFRGGSGLTFDSRFSNCQYGTGGSNLGDAKYAVVCTVNTRLDPGETVTLDPVTLGVLPTAFYADVQVTVEDSAIDLKSWQDEGFHFTPGDPAAHRLTVGKPETAPTPTTAPDLLPDGSGTGFQAEVQNTADFAATGSWTPDASGTTGKLTAGLTNNGPASVSLSYSGDDPADVLVTLPEQIKATPPTGCILDNNFKDDTTVRYICKTTDWIPVGYKASFDFTLDLNGATAPAAVVEAKRLGVGSNGPLPMPWDTNPGNDKLTVSLTATTPTTTPTDTGATGATGSTGSTEDNAPETPLASTGASGIGTTTALGLGALAAGGALLYATRRRKAGARQ